MGPEDALSLALADIPCSCFICSIRLDANSICEPAKGNSPLGVFTTQALLMAAFVLGGALPFVRQDSLMLNVSQSGVIEGTRTIPQCGDTQEKSWLLASWCCVWGFRKQSCFKVWWRSCLLLRSRETWLGVLIEENQSRLRGQSHYFIGKNRTKLQEVLQDSSPIDRALPFRLKNDYEIQ